jgi:hypothetical protein
MCPLTMKLVIIDELTYLPPTELHEDRTGPWPAHDFCKTPLYLAMRSWHNLLELVEQAPSGLPLPGSELFMATQACNGLLFPAIWCSDEKVNYENCLRSRIVHCFGCFANFSEKKFSLVASSYI